MKNLVALIDKPSEKTTLSDLNLKEISGDEVRFKSVENIYDGREASKPLRLAAAFPEKAGDELGRGLSVKEIQRPPTR